MNEHKTHPALQTNNYVQATTFVPDKYGIIQLSSDLLIAMHEADMSSLKDDATEDVSLNASVIDNFTQLADAMEYLAKDMGIEAKFKF